MSSFRGTAQINEELYRRTHPPKNDPPGGEKGGNKGTLVLDATVAPADIRYTTDLSLLNGATASTASLPTLKILHKPKPP